MKKTLLTLLVLALLTACEHIEIAEETNTDTPTEQLKTKDVQFVVAGITEEYSTRATIQSVGMTDLWVWDGETLLKHQVSTDEDFGLPVVTLTYGSHDLTFVCSKADGQSVASGVWSCSKVKDTFGKTMNVTVSGGSSTSRQVQLARRSSKLCFDIQDAIPAGVKTMHIKADNHLSLSADLSGGSAAVYDVSVDVSESVGKTYAPVVNLLTASATDEEDVDVMIEFLDASNSALYHYERTVKVKPNRCTTLKGEYFSGGSMQVTVDDAWLSELEVPLFSE